MIKAKHYLCPRSYIGVLAASSLALTTATSSWAVYSCKQPNPSTVLCASIPPGVLTSCSSAGFQSECDGAGTAEIENFPDGTVRSEAGSTAQEQKDCIRTRACVWNPDGAGGIGECVADHFWGAWQPAAKTVVGTNPCPTSEGG